MDIVAIIGCRNEEAYMANCLRHLLENSISFAVIDHDSTDGTRDVVRRPDLRRGLVAYETLPFDGTFALQAQLTAKEALAERLAADWIIHLDADEIMHSDRDGESLHDAISRIAAAAFNVINFDEFVFLPVDHGYRPDATGPQPMRHYYFFEPGPRRLMRAWNRQAGLSMMQGGHRLAGPDIRVATESLALRHYIFRNQDHAFSKYAERRFAKHELQEQNWHLNRVDQPVSRFRLPPPAALETLASPGSHALSTAHPKRTHYWQWDTAALTSADRIVPATGIPVRRESSSCDTPRNSRGLACG